MKNLFSFTVLLFLTVQTYSQCSDLYTFNNEILSKSWNELKVQKSEPHTLFDARKNTVSLDFIIMFPALGYSRIIPFNRNKGFVLSASATPNWGFTVDLSGGLIFGTHKHFVEPTVGYLAGLNNIYAKLGYRFQGNKGLLLKIAPGWSLTENSLYLTSGIGYAF